MSAPQNSSHQEIDWQALGQSYNELVQENGTLRSRDIAQKLNVPEAALYELGLGLISSERLNLNYEDILNSLGELGEIMSLVRNEYAVHEKIGEYQTVNVHTGPKMATVLGSDIDQRVFYSQWGDAYRFKMNGRKGELEGVVIFDKSGEASLKLYKREKTNDEAWEKLFSSYSENAEKPQYLSPREKREEQDIDEEKFLESWKNLKDTHEFHGLLMSYGVSRTQALKIAEGKFANKLHNQTAVDLLSRVASAGMPFMVFVGNPGIIQIHDGIIHKTFTQSGWLNIMDPAFNLHLDMEGIAETWHVVKPTTDGDVNSIELYDKEGEQIVTFFSSRKPGTPEREVWSEIIAQVSQQVEA